MPNTERQRAQPRSGLCRVLGAAIAIAIIGSCAAPSLPAPPNAANFWDALRITGDEAEGYASLTEMSQGADFVVIGKFAPRLSTRTVQGDAAEDKVAYLVTSVEVSRVLAGTLIDPIVPMELLLGHGMPAADEMAKLEEALPDGDMVIFVRAKRGKAEGGLYRPVNSYGLWASSSRGPLDTPLSEFEPQVSIYQVEIASLASVQAFADYVTRISGAN